MVYFQSTYGVRALMRIILVMMENPVLVMLFMSVGIRLVLHVFAMRMVAALMQVRLPPSGAGPCLPRRLNTFLPFPEESSDG